MPKMNGFELYKEIEKIDNKAKVCFVSSFVVYYELLREVFPRAKLKLFYQKTHSIDDSVERIIITSRSLSFCTCYIQYVLQVQVQNQRMLNIPHICKPVVGWHLRLLKV